MPAAHVAPVDAPPQSASPVSPQPPLSWEPSGERETNRTIGREERREEIKGRGKEKEKKRKGKGKEKGKK
jgi:hypothetical protein